MTNLLRDMLDIRDALLSLEGKFREYGYLEQSPELKQMQDLERQLFNKVQEWEKP